MASCLVEYCRARRDDYGVLIELLDVFTLPNTAHFQSVRDFFASCVAGEYSAAHRLQVLHELVTLNCQQTTSSKKRTAALRYVALPVLQKAVEQGDIQSVVDAALVKRIFELFDTNTQNTVITLIFFFLKKKYLIYFKKPFFPIV